MRKELDPWGISFDLVKDGKMIPEYSAEKWVMSDSFVSLKPQDTKPTADPWNVMIRPSDFAAWRRQVSEFEYNQEIFLKILDVLEADPEIWIDLSY